MSPLLSCHACHMQVSRISPNGIAVLPHSFMADLPSKHELPVLQAVLEDCMSQLVRQGTGGGVLPSEKERQELLAASDNAAFLKQALNDFLYRPRDESMHTCLANFIARMMREVRPYVLAFSMRATARE